MTARLMAVGPALRAAAGVGAAGLLITGLLAGCGALSVDDEALPSSDTVVLAAPSSTIDLPTTATPTTTQPTTDQPTTSDSPSTTTPRPPWLGRRTVPTDATGIGQAVETPAELSDRRFATIDTLPPPPDDEFLATVENLAEVPEALARSTWVEGCPVPPDELAYLTVSFHGFDGWNHTGELIVHSSVADDIVSVFAKLHQARFPIEELRIVTPADLDGPPTGDGNNSGGFVCRPVTGGTAFSEHAKGLAVDLNPFHNPYVRGDRVLPEQATAYTDRTLDRPGMIQPDDVVVRAFAAIGWTWGGDWTSLSDYQHFSASGR